MLSKKNANGKGERLLKFGAVIITRSENLGIGVRLESLYRSYNLWIDGRGL